MDRPFLGIVKKIIEITLALLKMIFYILLGLAVLVVFNYMVMDLLEARRVYTVENVPEQKIAIVFGAGLLYSGEPTAVLRDRVETAVKLYQSGKIQAILMTGDNSTENYNEPAAMRQYALELEVPDRDLHLDYAGRRTYDSCYRAKEIFGVSQAILVTQRFHLVRALFLCEHLGLESYGVEANNRQYRKLSFIYWNFREIFARNVAILDLIIRPEPILGVPEPINLEDKNGTK